MTNHALEAAKRIYPESRFPDVGSNRLMRDELITDAVPIIQAAIDAATADKDKRIAELEKELSLLKEATAGVNSL